MSLIHNQIQTKQREKGEIKDIFLQHIHIRTFFAELENDYEIFDW